MSTEAETLQEESELQKLVAKFSEQDMPIFSGTARSVAALSAKDEGSITELSLSILKDPSLTAKVLRVASSIHYNRDERPVTTVSRAVIQLGFNAIQNVCLSASLLEVLLKGARRDHVVCEMGKSLHAAIQARRISQHLKDPFAEEVFISALLHRIGHIAFWSFGGELSDKLEQAIYDNPKEPQEKLEREVLGFSLNEMTAKLVDDWNLSDMLRDSLKSDKLNDSRVRNVHIGHFIANRAAEHGFDSTEFEEGLKSVSKLLKLEFEDARKLIKESAVETVDLANEFGIKNYARFVPLEIKAGKPVEVSEIAADIRDPAPLLLLDVLSEINTLYRKIPFNFNGFLSTLIEGIARGLGMDRVMLALVTPDRKMLTGRYGLGWNSAELAKFEFDVAPSFPTVFSKVVAEKDSWWVNGGRNKHGKYLTNEVSWRVKCESFYVGTLQTRGKGIGVICADRRMSARPLDEDTFTSFKFIMQIVNSVLGVAL